MKKILIVIFLVIISEGPILAHGPQNKKFGFGIVLGEPTGLTVKYWTANLNALNFTLGGRSYFGSPRVGVDYLWHFYAFDTRVVNIFAGPGFAIGFGEGGNGFWYEDKKGRFFVRSDNNGPGIGVRGVFGLNVVPEATPLEFFLEFGVLVGLAPDVGSAADFAIGMRFYP